MVGRAAILACLAALALVPAAPGAPLPGGRAIAVTASISPDVHLFAEPVVVRIEIVIDRTQFDPGRVELQTSFAPYELLGPVDESRRTVGDIVELSYTATLRCLDADCVAPRFRTALGEQEGGLAERYTFRFQPAEILYEHSDGRIELLLQRPLPALEVVSRINTAQLDAAGTYTASLKPPAATYRLGPRWLAGGAFALAALLLLLPASLVARAVLSRWRTSRRPRRLSPLERALVLVEWAGRQADGEHDRRRALEALADVLERGGAVPLAETTRTLAWGERAPPPERAGELAAEARSALEGGGNGRAR